MTVAAAQNASSTGARNSWVPQLLQVLRQDVISLSNQALGEAEGCLSRRTCFPMLDVHETDDAIVIAMDLPGVLPAVIDVK